MSVSAGNMSKELKYEYYLIIKLQNKYIFQIIDGKYRNLHFSTFICIEQVLNIVTFSKYFCYTVSISPITKCRVGEIDTMILKFLHGVKKHPNINLRKSNSTLMVSNYLGLSIIFSTQDVVIQTMDVLLHTCTWPSKL